MQVGAQRPYLLLLLQEVQKILSSTQLHSHSSFNNRLAVQIRRRQSGLRRLFSFPIPTRRPSRRYFWVFSWIGRQVGQVGEKIGCCRRFRSPVARLRAGGRSCREKG